MMVNDPPFTRTQIAILVLLACEDKNNTKYSPIPGRMHLVKELFAICQDDLGKILLPELKFEPDNFGPFDETIFAALDGLKDGGFIFLDTSPRKKIRLTKDGIEVADKLLSKLKADVKILFAFTKRNYNHLTSEMLLEKIYSAYPEMTINSMSKVAEKYRPNNRSEI